MNKLILAKNVSKKLYITKEEAMLVLNACLEEIAEALEDGNKVSLYEFGTFETKVRPKKEYYIPTVGEKVTVDDAMLVSFKPSTKLKQRINLKKE